MDRSLIAPALIAVGLLAGCEPTTTAPVYQMRVYPPIERIARVAQQGDAICSRPPSRERADRLARLNAENPGLEISCRELPQLSLSL